MTIRKLINAALGFTAGVFTSALAAAHSFPKDYKLSGTRADQVKQIGNSIPVQTAKAIVKAIFTK